MIEIEIDGKKIQTQPGKMLIQVADEAGIYIPRFCYHKKLSIAANCRMCLVEVEKAPKTLPACATPVANGMKAFTRSEATKKSQKAVMEFLLINHPLDCPICDQGGECELQDLALGFGRDVSRFHEGKRSIQDEDLGPLVGTFMTRCIQCTRCVRFGHEIAGLEELGALGRGENMRIGTEVLELRDMNAIDVISSGLRHIVKSEVSGNIIDLCPVGALTSKPFLYQARAWEMQQRPSIAPHDCLGSHIHVHTRGYEYSSYRDVMRVVPDHCEEINEMWISDQDRFSYLGLTHPDRIGKPMIKQDNQWREVDWSIALNFAADHLREIGQQTGGDKIGGLISPSSTVEECFLAQQLLRGLGSNNIDHRLQQIDFSDDEFAFEPTLGIHIAELETRDHLLLIGSDLHHEQPIAGIRIRKGVLKGGRVSVINPFHCMFRFNVAHQFISKDIFDELAGIAKALEIEATCLSQIHPTEQQKQLAKQLQQGKKHSVILGALALNHPYASVIKALAQAIADKVGASYGCLTPGANSTGAWLAKCFPNKNGLNAHAMLTAKLNAFLLLGIEPELDCAKKGETLSAMENAFVIALTPFATDTMRHYADVLLPSTPFTENEGTLINIENKIQGFEPATIPWQESRPAWKILRVLGNLLKLEDFEYANVEEVEVNFRASLTNSEVAKRSFLLNQLKVIPKISEKYEIPYWPLYRGDMLVRRSEALQKMIEKRGCCA